MLIEFSVANFASIREKQTLSMAAAPQLRKRENTIEAKVRKEKLPKLLKAVAIYGPNASGKSNILKAFDVLQKIVTSTPTAKNNSLPVDPFRFDKRLKDEPSVFEIHFIHKELRYSFELHATKEYIVFERLASYPEGNATVLYTRERTISGESYLFGDDLEGDQLLHEVWRRSTNSRVCFISQAVANSNEEFTQLSDPFAWLSRSTLYVDGDLADVARYSQMIMRDNDGYRDSLVRLLDDVDVPISKITVQQNPLIEPQPSKPPLDEIDKFSGENLRTLLTHRTNLGEADFELREESRGTQSLIGFMLPWFLFKDSTTKDDPYGTILIVDELDASLHPNIVADLIRRHIENEGRSCQIIFTSHNTNLMDRKLFRRDQFWITERDENGATQLRSIHEFQGRGDEDLEKRYFEGRYRGLPYLVKG